LTPARWKQIEAAFERALALPPATRRAFLERDCAATSTTSC
jgi:hypothetical protein